MRPVQLTALAVVVAFTVLPARARADIKRDAKFRARVEEAIDAGVRYLRSKQAEGGSWPTRYDQSQPCAGTAMVYHTLSVCGADVDAMHMVEGYDALRRQFKAAHGGLPTYATGLTMLAIADHAVAMHGDSIDAVRGESDRGNATRAKGRAKKNKAKNARSADRTWMERLTRRLVASQSSTGGWHYGGRQYGGGGGGGFDNSNTQYAILGLRAAARMGVEPPLETWSRAFDHLLSCQATKGPKVPRPRPKGSARSTTHERHVDTARGWTYSRFARRGGMPTTATMTFGCLGSLVITRAQLWRRGALSPDQDALGDTAIADGFAWTSKWSEGFRKPSASLRGFRGGYLLYAIERAARLGNRDYLGELDWYAKGVEELLATQNDDGSFSEAYGSTIATCFALLFLRRATEPVVRETPVTGDEPLDWDTGESARGDAFEGFVDLVLSRWRRAPSDASRAALTRGTASLGPRVVLPLLRRMDSSAERTRVAAHALLAAITGEELAFDATVPEPQRAAALEAWELWYLRSGALLEYQPEAGRLVIGSD